MALFFRQSTVSLLFRCHSIIAQKLHQAGGDLVRRSQRFDGTAIIATRAEQICFGGMGIYKSDVFKHEPRYAGPECEHVGLHNDLIDAGIDNIYMNPNQIILYSNVHYTKI